MSVGWHDIVFQIDETLAREAQIAWSWLFPEQWTPLLCSKIGGIFLQTGNGVVNWLDTGTGSIEQVASSREVFEAKVLSNSPEVEEWFLVGLVEKLHRAGKRANTGQCYAFKVLPIFAEGKYEIDNILVVSMREQLVGVAAVHHQLSLVPDGSQVRIEVTD